MTKLGFMEQQPDYKLNGGFLIQYYYFTLLFKGMKDLIACNYSFYFFKSIQD